MPVKFASVTSPPRSANIGWPFMPQERTSRVSFLLLPAAKIRSASPGWRTELGPKMYW
ncbi:MAG: hypothetical protein QOD69_946 [Solirubrobacteraceae bacterium]|nr:hypothetical protein [Solirubrobacteraceae bacterium]